MTSVDRLNKGVKDGWRLPGGFAIKVRSSEMTAVMENSLQEVMKANGKAAGCFE